MAEEIRKIKEGLMIKKNIFGTCLFRFLILEWIYSQLLLDTWVSSGLKDITFPASLLTGALGSYGIGTGSKKVVRKTTRLHQMV